MTKFCPTCEDDREVRTEKREEKYTVRGKSISVPVTVEVCTTCGEALGSDEQDQEIMDAVYTLYRKEMGLLSPEEIKGIRKRYGLSQKSFAALLGMSEATINRYEQGGLQDPSHDRLLRTCESPEYIRGLLQDRGNLLSEWQRNKVEEALAGQVGKAGVPLDMISLFRSKGVSEYTGFRQFNFERLSYVVIWFCKKYGSISTTVINKLLFFADFLNFKKSTVSLTGMTYVKLPYGPVPDNYDFLLRKMEIEDLVIKEEKEVYNGNTGYYYRPGPKKDSVVVVLTDYEQKVLEYVAEKFRGLKAIQISERSHRESAWLNTEDKKEISYSEAMKLTLDLPDPGSDS